MSQKLMFFPVLLIAACVFSAIYGVLHNQVSYTLSHYYFFAYQFGRFDIPIEHWNRFGATLVGVYGSWWMGLVIGPLILLVGLILPGWKAYLKHSLIAFGVVTGTALLTGLTTLAIARFTSNDKLRWASEMHENCYLGGYLGVVTGSLYLFVVWLRIRRAKSAAPPGLVDV